MGLIENNLNFDGILNGSEKMIATLFPSVRAVMIEKCKAEIERYRVETFLRIGMQAEQIIETLNIEVKPIPPKAALPLFDKMSLEHEDTMYEMWAKLLVATAEGYDPIQIQYAEILSKIGHIEAVILNDIFQQQKQNSDGKTCLIKFQYYYDIIADPTYQSGERMLTVNVPEEPEYKVEFPDDKVSTYSVSSNKLPSSKSILTLERLGLLKKFPLAINQEFHIVLSEFGYTFVETLKKYNVHSEVAACNH